MKIKNNDGKYFLKAKELDYIYQDLNLEIIDNIIKRLQARGTQDLISNPYIWQLEKLNDMHLLTEDVVKSISKRSGVAEKVFRDVIANEGYEIYLYSHVQLRKALESNSLPDPLVQKSLNALVDQTIYDLNNMINTTLPLSVRKNYEQLLTNAVAGVVTGSKSSEKALNDAVFKLYERGFTGFIDRGGRHWSVDRYARTVLKTTVRRTYREMREKPAEELGIDTFYYSTKSSARELCAPLQHKIVTKGVSRTIKGEKVLSLSDYGYGSPAGCLGINCGHYLTPFVVGINEKPDLPEINNLSEEELKENALAKARQRAFEREIRKSKEIIYISNRLGDKESEQHHKLKLKTLQMGLKKHIEKYPFLYRDKSRERLVYNAKNSFLKSSEKFTKPVAIIGNKVYNEYMERKKNISNDTISVASKSLINKLSRKFRRRGGKFIDDEEARYYLDSRQAEAVTLDAYTILKRDKISISALIEELEHAEQYLRNENDGTQLSIIKNEILAKEKSIQDSLRYKLPKKEIDFVKSQISEYKEKYRRIKNENTKKL